MSDPTFVLVPGAAGTSFGWVPVVRELALRGHRALAVELPGHGFDAVFPAGFGCPQDLDVLASAVSPLAGRTLDDYVAHVLETVRAVAAHGPVVLVGHSLGGSVVTGVANLVPDLLARIVYVSAYCCVELPNVLAYAQAPENAESLLPTAPGLGDPARTGAMRTNPRTGDPEELAALAAITMGDLDPSRVPAVLAYATQPAESMQAALADARVEPSTWGRVPRSYLRTALDRALPLALQDRMIAEADRLTPANPFEMHTLHTSHLAPITRAGEIAGVLARPWLAPEPRATTRAPALPRFEPHERHQGRRRWHLRRPAPAVDRPRCHHQRRHRHLHPDLGRARTGVRALRPVQGAGHAAGPAGADRRACPRHPGRGVCHDLSLIGAVRSVPSSSWPSCQSGTSQWQGKVRVTLDIIDEAHRWITIPRTAARTGRQRHVDLVLSAGKLGRSLARATAGRARPGRRSSPADTGYYSTYIR